MYLSFIRLPVKLPFLNLVSDVSSLPRFLNRFPPWDDLSPPPVSGLYSLRGIH